MADETTRACGVAPGVDSRTGEPLPPEPDPETLPSPTCEGGAPHTTPPSGLSQKPALAAGDSAPDNPADTPGALPRKPNLGRPDGRFKFTAQERAQQVRRLGQARKKAKATGEKAVADGLDLELATSAGMRDHLIKRLRQDPDDVQARRDLMELCGMKKSIGSGEVMRMTNFELDNLIYDWVLPALAPYGVLKYVIPKKYQEDYKKYIETRNKWRERQKKGGFHNLKKAKEALACAQKSQDCSSK